MNIGSSDLIVRWWTILTVVLLAAFTLPHFIDFLQVQFWRHDSIYYVLSYGNKLEGEGRWLNYYAFSSLKLVPAWLSLLVSYGAIGYFAYCCSYRLNRDLWFSLLLALATLNIPLLRMQLEWPTTLLPAFILLFLAPWLARRIPDFVFFPVYGVLLFGSFSSLYFLLPLLYLPYTSIKTCARILFLWVASFVFGYLVSQLIVWEVTGDIIKVAGWRHPKPIDSLLSFTANLQSMWVYLSSHFQFMVATFTAPLFLLALVWSLAGGSPLRRAALWGTAGLVFLAPYVTTLPYGIVVSGRTAFISMLALLFALCAHERANHWYRASGALLLLCMGVTMAQVTSAYTDWYKGLTDGIVKGVREAMPLAPQEVDAVYIRIDDTQWRSFTDWVTRSKALVSPSMFSEDLGSAHYRRSLVASLGYERVIVCGDGLRGACEEPLSFPQKEVIPNYAIYGQVVEGASILLSMPHSALE